jgi:hypothetical protein
VPFDLAIIGEEVSGRYSADSMAAPKRLTREIVQKYGGFLLSEKLWDRLQPRVDFEILASGLRWVPIRTEP